MHISLNHILLTWLHINVLPVPSQEYASSLTCCHRFHNECFSLFLGELILKVIGILRQNPSFRREIEVLFEELRHSLYVPSKIILMAQSVHSRVVIDSLIRLHLLQLTLLRTCISPIYVPITILILIQFEVLHST